MYRSSLVQWNSIMCPFFHLQSFVCAVMFCWCQIRWIFTKPIPSFPHHHTWQYLKWFMCLFFLYYNWIFTVWLHVCKGLICLVSCSLLKSILVSCIEPLSHEVKRLKSQQILEWLMCSFIEGWTPDWTSRPSRINGGARI